MGSIVHNQPCYIEAESDGMHEQHLLPSLDIIHASIREGRIADLDSMVVIPSFIDPDMSASILFSSDIWTAKPCMFTQREGMETFRKANFSDLENELKIEAKVIATFFLWFSRRRSKLNSIIRNIEQLIVICKCLQSIGVKSIFWLNRNPIREKFISTFSKGKSNSTINNYLQVLKSVCAINLTSLSELGYVLEYNFKEISSGRDDNQTLCMPFMVLSKYWQSYMNHFDNLHFNYDNVRYLASLPGRYRRYLEANNLKPNHKYKEKFFELYCKDELKAIYQDESCATKELITRREAGEIECKKSREYVFATKLRGKDYLAKCSTKNDVVAEYRVDFENLAAFYNRTALLAVDAMQAMTGMRISEARSIKFGSLIKDNGCIGISATLHKFSGENGSEEHWAAAPYVETIFDKIRLLASSFFNVDEKDNLNNMFIKTNARAYIDQGRLVPMSSQRKADLLIDWSNKHQIRLTKEDVDEFWSLNPNISRPDVIRKSIFVGAVWPLKSHQFRRSIAVHVRRLSLVDMKYLSFQLKHLSRTQSEWYTSGSELEQPRGLIPRGIAKELEKASLELSATMAMKFQGASNLYGRGGKRLEEHQPESPLAIYPSFEKAMQMAKKNEARVMSLGNGMYCLNGAECSFTAVVQAAKCNPECENLIADSDSIPVWQRRYSKYKAMYENALVNQFSDDGAEFLRLEMEFYHDALKQYGVEV
ncbi:hypothetical protein [Ferrimonas sp. YFM]|uniref:hypothetical protein n=1 Tax=Ferrimonas sp. YFM TaxID=3028878 RepID=UPI002574050F|nr:hypothetical protein [Ferrimonas sp. YFM]BDY07066.1 hypothetical protein F0521_41070 [Ferrimonas sp. YFM]